MILLILGLYALYLIKNEDWVGLAGLVFGFIVVNMFYALT